MRGRILVIDDDIDTCDALREGLGRRQFQVTATTSPSDGFATLTGGELDAAVTDLNMTEMNGLALCERVVANRPDVPVVVITGFGSFETAVAAIRAGAYDFITKPIDLNMLALTLDRAVAHRALREEVKALRERLAAKPAFADLLGNSPAMRAVTDLLARVTETESSVLLTGESGTGKEVVARALHTRGRRAAGPFVAVSCAAMPESLLESELFGHAKGAFTDAKSARAGLFVQANGGTLFLDEIGELPPALQPKLLRALQERRVRPVGGDAEIPFDARLVVATNRDLETAVEEHRFREDLYFRINVIQIELPPLRARGNDVLVLAQHFLRQHAARAGKAVSGISSAAAERLLAYSWPGNVRELQNCVERAVALTRFEQIVVEDLPERIRAYRGSQIIIASDDPAALVSMEEVERRYILRVVDAVGGNRGQAARILGLDRKTLYRKLERFHPGGAGGG